MKRPEKVHKVQKVQCILNLKDPLYPLLGSELHRNSCCHIELSSQGWIRRCLAVSRADSYARLLIEINLDSQRKNPTMPIGLCLRTLPFPLIKCCRSVLTHLNCSVAMFCQSTISFLATFTFSQPPVQVKLESVNKYKCLFVRDIWTTRLQCLINYRITKWCRFDTVVRAKIRPLGILPEKGIIDVNIKIEGSMHHKFITNLECDFFQS